MLRRDAFLRNQLTFDPIGTGYRLRYRGATGLFLKGQDVATELTEARKAWSFASELLPSQSDPRGRIVQVKRLSRAR